MYLLARCRTSNVNVVGGQFNLVHQLVEMMTIMGYWGRMKRKRVEAAPTVSKTLQHCSQKMCVYQNVVVSFVSCSYVCMYYILMSGKLTNFSK